MLYRFVLVMSGIVGICGYLMLVAGVFLDGSCLRVRYPVCGVGVECTNVGAMDW